MAFYRKHRIITQCQHFPAQSGVGQRVNIFKHHLALLLLFGICESFQETCLKQTLANPCPVRPLGQGLGGRERPGCGVPARQYPAKVITSRSRATQDLGGVSEWQLPGARSFGTTQRCNLNLSVLKARGQ